MTALVVTGAEAFKLTVDKVESCNGTPPPPFKRDEAVPGCTLPDWTPPATAVPADCGLWVFTCEPEPDVAVSWLSAIVTIVKQYRASVALNVGVIA